MKKLFATLLLAVMTLAASAQIKSIDIKTNLRNDFGLGVGLTAGLVSNLDIAPSFNYYFGNDTFFTLEGDFHYNFQVAQDFQVYPIAGLAFADDAGTVKVGADLGAGVKYALVGKVGLFFECKYQWLKDNKDVYLSLGVNIGI